MKLSLRQWLGLTGAVAGCHLALPAMANTCAWDGASGPMDFQADVGTVYVPRDARIGSVIGVIDKFVSTTNPGGAGHHLHQRRHCHAEFQHATHRPHRSTGA